MIKQGQIWIETVIYTLIILVIIGVLLSILTPVINKQKDQSLLQQSVGMLDQIDTAINDMRDRGAGNSIPIEFQIKKGQLTINSVGDEMNFVMRSVYMYSEPNRTVDKGRIKAVTIDKGKDFEITLRVNYSGIVNITWNRKDTEKIFYAAPSTYTIMIANYGRNFDNPGELINIDLNQQ